MITTRTSYTQMDMFKHSCICCACLVSLKQEQVIPQDSGYFLCKKCHPNHPTWLLKQEEEDE